MSDLVPKKHGSSAVEQQISAAMDTVSEQGAQLIGAQQLDDPPDGQAVSDSSSDEES